MTEKTESIVEEVLHLPRESRALLAEKLLESLDHEEAFDVSPEWMDEIRKRCREIDAGTVALSSSEEVFEELDKSLG
jgi:putative addiction module component (TIGR02574 family)